MPPQNSQALEPEARNPKFWNPQSRTSNGLLPRPASAWLQMTSYMPGRTATTAFGTMQISVCPCQPYSTAQLKARLNGSSHLDGELSALRGNLAFGEFYARADLLLNVLATDSLVKNWVLVECTIASNSRAVAIEGGTVYRRDCTEMLPAGNYLIQDPDGRK